MVYEKPLPLLDPDGKPFWESCRQHAARLQRCADCQRFRFPPSLLCAHCGSDQAEWVPITGRGTVYTTITVHQVPGKGWEQNVPFNAAIVELEEGARLWSNVIGCPPEAVSIGMPVEIVYDDVTEEVTLPKFRPAAS